MLVPNLSDLKQPNCKKTNTLEIDNVSEKVDLFEEIDKENAKERKKIITKIEGIVRRSPEYTALIGYMKNNLNLTSCLFHKDVNISELKKTTLEFHHYPFTLYDIVDTVLNKYLENHTKINPFEIAEEVMKLHYELKIGLVPLSKTIHQLAHSGKIFINLNLVTQSYLKFIASYSKYINPELIENWKNLKDLSIKQNNGELEDNQILEEMRLHIKMDNIDLPKELKVEEEEDIIA